jgi:hypothetical protein
MSVTWSAPASSEPVVRVALKKLGQLTCRHFYRVIKARSRMFLKCDRCDRETVGIVVADRISHRRRTP